MAARYDSFAYENAIARNIATNARKGRAKRWAEEYGERAERVEAFLWAHGEFASTEARDENGCSRYVENPIRKASLGDFFFKMRDALDEWGSLTDGQMKAVEGMIERGEQRAKDRADAAAERAKSAEHIGSVKERRDWTLKIGKVLSFDGMYGVMFIHLMDDVETGNPVVYKGSKLLGEDGETVTVKATVKAHEVRDGVKQTIIARPA